MKWRHDEDSSIHSSKTWLIIMGFNLWLFSLVSYWIVVAALITFTFGKVLYFEAIFTAAVRSTSFLLLRMKHASASSILQDTEHHYTAVSLSTEVNSSRRTLTGSVSRYTDLKSTKIHYRFQLFLFIEKAAINILLVFTLNVFWMCSGFLLIKLCQQHLWHSVNYHSK